MNLNKNWVSQVSFIVSSLLVLTISFPAFASSISGGVMTLNINNTQLAAAFPHDTTTDRSSFYLEEYFNSAQAASRTSAELLTDHIVLGAGEISSVGRQFTVNGLSTTGLNIANDFEFDPNDLAGTATGAIGLGGAMRFRLDIPFITHPETGEEAGNRAINGYLSLEYNGNAAIEAGYPEWTIYNHYSFRNEVFNLENVVTDITENSLTLSGDISLAGGFVHMGGEYGTIVGDFNFQTTVVPVPAAVWLFASGLAGLFVSGRANKKVLS